jgi:Mpv17 / PMP22 family
MTNAIQKISSEAHRGIHDILEETESKARQMLWPTMKQHWKLWPAVHSLNFYFVPLQHRVLLQNTVLVGWSGYLSHLNKNGLEANEGKLFTPKEEIEAAIQITNAQGS